MRSAREEDHPLMRRALSLQRAGDNKGAIEAYQRVIDTKPGFARAHLNAAILYTQPPDEDFVRAIYHYERYLSLRPDAENAAQVRDLARRARVNFAASLPATNPNDALELVAELRRENEGLKQQIELLQQAARPAVPTSETFRASSAVPPPLPPPSRPVLPAPRPAQTPVAAPTPAAPRTHTVVAGETLSSIASKVYNDPSAWRKVYDANRDKLANPAALRPGQVLATP